MGYTTEFEGKFTITPELSQEHMDYLNQFSETRRMKRDPKILEGFQDSFREGVGLPLGTDGEYFVGGKGHCGQDHDASIIDYNEPPSTQPSLWCQWIANDGGNSIEWDGGEKFYDYIDWIKYLISNFLKPWGYSINGTVKWRGEGFSDIGKIVIIDNQVQVHNVKF